MGFTIVKNIDQKNIKIIESYYTYTILYKLPYITLSGIAFQLTDITIENVNNHYKINLSHEGEIQFLNMLDKTLISKIPNYTVILKHDKNISYILFKKNTVVDSILNSNTSLSTITINIFKIKKYASHSYPLVYIL